MIELCLTIDAESSKEARGDQIVHREFERDVLNPCLALDRLAQERGAELTFCYPLSELEVSDPRAVGLASRLAERHELAVHLHRPFAAWTATQTADLLGSERLLLEAAGGGSVTAVRAGGYNTGDQTTWIAAMHAAGLTVDSSVWPGASTSTSWESARGAVVDGRIWGGGGVAYDYRGAPTGGAYRTAADSLVRPGEGGVIEAPIGAAVYEEVEARPFLLDVHGMTFEVLVRAIEHLGRIAEGKRALVVVLLHSYGVSRGTRLTAVGERVAALLEWAAGEGIAVRGLGGVTTETLGEYGPIWALDQHARWTPVDRRELVSLVTRCPRCGSALGDLRCSACGWSARALSPTLIDARTEATQPPVVRSTPSRGNRYLRALLALSGGLIGVAAGNALSLAARARRLLVPRRPPRANA